MIRIADVNEERRQKDVGINLKHSAKQDMVCCFVMYIWRCSTHAPKMILEEELYYLLLYILDVNMSGYFQQR